MNNKPTYTFNDVLIKPKYSEVESRREVDISSKFEKFNLSLPIISANMKSITGPSMAEEMFRNGGIGILHRFNTIDQACYEYGNTMKRLEDFKDYKDVKVGVSIGVQHEDQERFEKLYEMGARLFCIDIAHGHCYKMKETLSWLKLYEDVITIAGNVATPEGARDLYEWGARIVKVGIGPGAACTTRKNCGVGMPQLYALELIKDELQNTTRPVGIIADGGIKTCGDIAKALKFADAVMVGSFVSGTSETNGEVFKDDTNHYYKMYSGSASGENKTSNGDASEYVEGISLKVPFRGSVKYILKEIKEALQSSFSYTNSRNLKEFQNNCEFVKLTGSGKEESKI